MKVLNIITLLSIVLCIVLFVCPASAETMSGSCGNDITWTLSDGVLNIEGTGEMVFLEITGIENGAGIHTVKISEGITSICDHAFYKFESLKAVEIPNSVKHIGYGAFWYCLGLESIDFPDYLETLDTGAFGWCPFTEIELPETLKSIPQMAFYYCQNLSSVSFPENLESIGSSAFLNCTNLTNITIPDKVTHIGEAAFYHCTGIKTLTIGKDLKSISDEAFFQLESLETIYWNATNADDLNSINRVFENTGHNGEGITAYFGNNVTHIPAYLFYPCSDADSYTTLHTPNLKTAYISNSVKTIGQQAFYDCKYLTDVNFPSSVVSIGEQAFAQSGIETVELSENIGSIGRGAFHGCKSLVSITVDENNTNYCSIDGHLFNKAANALLQYAIAQTNEEYIVPETVEIIGDLAVKENVYIKNITFPQGLKKICNYAFYGCSSLEKVILPESVTELEGYVFYGCSKISELKLSKNLTQIPAYAFYLCESIPSVDIHNGITLIGRSAFHGCDGITEIILPDSVTTLGDGAFGSCMSLKDVTLSKNIEIIPAYAFQHCNGLKGIVIPDGVTEIKYGAFKLCSHLNRITLPTSLETIGNYAFDSTSLSNVFYRGNNAEWDQMVIGYDNEKLTGAKRFLNYNDEPIVIFTSLNYLYVKAEPVNCDASSTDKIILATFDDEGRLMKVFIQNFAEELTFWNVSLNNKKGKAVLMLWNDLDACVPLALKNSMNFSFVNEGENAENGVISGGDKGGGTIGGGTAGGEVIGGVVVGGEVSAETTTGN